MEWITAIVAAVLSAITGIVVAYMSYRGVKQSNDKQTALVTYRLEQLEKKVDKHNQVIERTYKLEERASVLETELEDMKKKVG